MKSNFNTSFCRYRLFAFLGLLYAECSVDRLPLALEFSSLDTTFILTRFFIGLWSPMTTLKVETDFKHIT